MTLLSFQNYINIDFVFITIYTLFVILTIEINWYMIRYFRKKSIKIWSVFLFLKQPVREKLLYPDLYHTQTYICYIILRPMYVVSFPDLYMLCHTQTYMCYVIPRPIYVVSFPDLYMLCHTQTYIIILYHTQTYICMSYPDLHIYVMS